MKHENITVPNADVFENISRNCGATVTECSNVAGIVSDVMTKSRALQEKRSYLEDIARMLEAEQTQVGNATDEARLLSERAHVQLKNGASTIGESIAEFNDLVELVQAMGNKINDFASAMDQVMRTSESIDTIAKSTNMLALNAAIEAERAGAAGATFAVVAAEVKKLAQDTRVATDEITTTMKSLGNEASEFVAQVQTGIDKSQKAKSSFSKIETTISEVSEIVSMVDRQADDIAQSTSSVQLNTGKVCESLFSFMGDVDANTEELSGALDRINNLEMITNDMFDSMVHSGLSKVDNEFVAIAKKGAGELVEIVEKALANGSLSEDKLFDRKYEEISGSNPTRYNNGFNDFADSHIRAELDRMCELKPEIISAVCTNEDGYLPTHISYRSRKPTGDVKHDSEFCRNRRLLLDNITSKAVAQRDQEFIAAAYRFMANDETDYQVLKNIFVPLYFGGRYWGNFEIAYVS